MKLILFILFICMSASCSAQFFSRMKAPARAPVNTALRGRPVGVTAVDSTFNSFRPVANIAAFAVPANSLMAGMGVSYQNLTYTYATGKYFCNWSVSGVMFAGGNIAPSLPTATLTYAVLVGAFNNLIMIGPGLNDGKFQFIASIGISLNN